MSGTTSQPVGAFITLALKLTGAVAQGETPSAESSSDALALLNQMLGAWNAKRWDVYALNDVSMISTGAQSYMVGTGQAFDVPRPDRLEGAYMRQVNISNQFPVDYPLTLISAYEDYARISVKNLPSFAQYAFYDGDYPVGNVYFWPLPQADNFELHILTKTQLPQFTGLTQTVMLPPDYEEAVVYNLAARLAPLYGMKPDPTITAIALSSMSTIQNSNAQVPRLHLDRALAGETGWYNPFSDRMGNAG